MSSRSIFAYSLSITAICLTTGASALEPTPRWGRFRGANGSGVTSDCNVPLPWKAADVAWNIALPGKSNGSPVVAGKRVFLMSADPNSAKRYMLAYDLGSGKELWRKEYESRPNRIHRQSSYASCTPCVNSDAVFITWATPESVVLKALSHEGEERWTKDLGPFISQHGYGTSPAVFGDKLVLFVSQQAEQLPSGAKPGQSSVSAFDVGTGNLIWSTPRTATRTCYGVPALLSGKDGQDTLLFCNTGDGIFALDLSTGKPLWNNRVFGKRCVSSPLLAGDLVIGTEGSGGGGNILYAVDTQGDHQVRFKINRSAPYVPTPVAHGDLLFLWDDKGIVTCVRLPDGEVVWSKRIGGTVSTSPVIAGNKLIGISADGTVTILSASEQFANLGSIKLEDTTRATPLVAENYLLVRTDSKLICVGQP